MIVKAAVESYVQVYGMPIKVEVLVEFPFGR